MQELMLQAKKLHAEDGFLSPEREVELLGKISVLEDENAELKQ